MITTHIHTRPRPGQDAHQLTETCWCLPAITRLTRSRYAPELADHVVVDHDGQASASVEAEVRGRIVNPIVAALKDVCATTSEVEQARLRRTEAGRLRNHRRYHVNRGQRNPTCTHCQIDAAGGAA